MGPAIYPGILTAILPFTILYMVVSRVILRLSSKECQFKSFRKFCDYAGFPHIAVFHKSGGTPLDSFNIMTMLLSMWVPHAAGVLQTIADEGGLGLTFNTFWARKKIASDETKGPITHQQEREHGASTKNCHQSFGSFSDLLSVIEDNQFKGTKTGLEKAAEIESNNHRIRLKKLRKGLP